MKKLLFFILIIFIFSCEKEKEQEKQCWTCTTMKKPASGAWKFESSFETCEEGVKLLWDDKWVWDKQGGSTIRYVYHTTCQ